MQDWLRFKGITLVNVHSVALVSCIYLDEFSSENAECFIALRLQVIKQVQSLFLITNKDHLISDEKLFHSIVAVLVFLCVLSLLVWFLGDVLIAILEIKRRKA